jgi:hypothetical protein
MRANDRLHIDGYNSFTAHVRQATGLTATTVEYRGFGDLCGPVAVRYHWTDVVTCSETENGHGDRITIQANGYQTATTKKRINQWLPLPWVVSQTDYAWFLVNVRTGDTVPFYDGITLERKNGAWVLVA